MMKFILFSALVFAVSPLSARAVWVDPGCNPAVDGPDCATVSAPITTSDSSQTKEGALYVQDILSADDLTVNNSVSLPNDAISDAMVSDSITASQYVLKSGDTMNGALLVYLTSASNSITGYNYSSGGGVAGFSSSGIGTSGFSTDAEGVWAESTNSYGLRARSTNSYAVMAYSTNSKAIYGTAANNYAIQGEGSSSYAGVYGNNSAGPGVYGRTTDASSYGVLGCSGGTNCGYLGGATYAGYFNGPVYFNKKVEINNNLEIKNNRGLTLRDETGTGYCLKMYSSPAAAPPPAVATTIVGPAGSVLAIILGQCP